ncbi:MAG TPA: aconitase/3-isopropylmalate dehydratase large subunit family protein [Bacteroidales bacterium]|nr:aconitase/3-isopropylmalate dehydratase large subunit family protein [Bacteroidales bacterium]
MDPKTFAEKIFKAPAGSIVFARPDIILTHDNTSSIYKTFKKMGGKRVGDPKQMLVVLDHNAPPTDACLATQYQDIRDIVIDQGINKFYDAGKGICHQVMSYHAQPGMLIVGSDSHTSTAGAFNAFAAGIDRTEAAGIWKRGETWFRVPGSFKISLKGSLKENVTAKDLAIWIIGMIGADGANYLSVEYHGDGVKTLTVSDRMTLANMASEMGAKNAAFPPDSVLNDFYGEEINGIWADEGAVYLKEININLDDVFPVVSAPHNVDKVKAVSEVAGTVVMEGLIGTCTNGRLEDLRAAAEVLKGRVIKEGFQLNIIPASRKILLKAIDEGLVTVFIKSGANVLAPSCGPCLGTGQGIPANGHTVISTANRNFRGRMGNKEASIYLASPVTVAVSALKGIITDPRSQKGTDIYPYSVKQSRTVVIAEGENRRFGTVWDYSDVDNLNTDQMFAGKHTYKVLSSDPDSIVPLLMADFDPSFSKNVKRGDVIIAGDNFGCGSSREHPSVGFAHAGITAVIVKSVNRIFYRSSINQGLLLVVHPEAVKAYKQGDTVNVDYNKGTIVINDNVFHFDALPEKLKQIIEKRGLVNYMQSL